jgi:hypothetical protein
MISLLRKGELEQVQLSDRYASVTLVIRVFQDFASNTPTLKHANGHIDLPLGDVARTMMAQAPDPIEVELEDGRKAKILFTEIGGDFTVTGPIA